MRHRKRSQRLSRKTSHRKALLKNLVSSLLIHQGIQTTLPKAKEARRLADKLITLGKKGGLHHRRMAYSILGDRTLVFSLFTEIGPRFQKRAGGYTRIIKTSNRKGDGAQLAILELTEKKIVEPKPKPKHEKKPVRLEKKPPAKKPRPAAKEAPEKEVLPPKEKYPPEERERTKEKKAPKPEGEKKPPEKEKEGQREELKEKPKAGFLKGLRKLFGRRKK